MTLQIDVPPEIEEQLREKATVTELSVEDLAGKILEREARQGDSGVMVEGSLRDEREDMEREDEEVDRIALAWPDPSAAGDTNDPTTTT